MKLVIFLLVFTSLSGCTDGESSWQVATNVPLQGAFEGQVVWGAQDNSGGRWLLHAAPEEALLPDGRRDKPLLWNFETESDIRTLAMDPVTFEPLGWARGPGAYVWFRADHAPSWLDALPWLPLRLAGTTWTEGEVREVAFLGQVVDVHAIAPGILELRYDLCFPGGCHEVVNRYTGLDLSALPTTVRLWSGDTLQFDGDAGAVLEMETAGDGGSTFSAAEPTVPRGRLLPEDAGADPPGIAEAVACAREADPGFDAWMEQNPTAVLMTAQLQRTAGVAQEDGDTTLRRVWDLLFLGGSDALQAEIWVLTPPYSPFLCDYFDFEVEERQGVPASDTDLQRPTLDFSVFRADCSMGPEFVAAVHDKMFDSDRVHWQANGKQFFWDGVVYSCVYQGQPSFGVDAHTGLVAFYKDPEQGESDGLDVLRPVYPEPSLRQHAAMSAPRHHETRIGTSLPLLSPFPTSTRLALDPIDPRIFAASPHDPHPPHLNMFTPDQDVGSRIDR